MSWIDKLEQRVGLRPAPEPERPLTPSERADLREAYAAGLKRGEPPMMRFDIEAALDTID